jgi:MoaA/NifB/PqqE/SkfB family radical SAM enzyme
MTQKNNQYFPIKGLNPSYQRNLLTFLKKIPKLFIYLTTKCNFDCHHCYLGERLKQPQEFGLEDVMNIIRLFSNFKGEKDITFLGGEPLLYSKIGDVLKYAKEMGYYVRVDTNAFLMIVDILGNWLDYVDEVSISLDGASPEVHDSLRRKGSFNRVIKNIEKLKRKDKIVRVTTTVTNLNIHEILKLPFLLKNLGVDLLNLHLLSLNGNARNHPELWVTPSRWMSLITEIWKSEFKIRFPLAYLPENLVEDFKRNFKNLFACEIKRISRLSFFPDAKVYCCSLLFDTDLNIGIYDFSKKTVLLNDNSEYFLAKTQHSCIAKDFTPQEEGFVNICRFKKIQNWERRYQSLIEKIEEMQR